MNDEMLKNKPYRVIFCSEKRKVGGYKTDTIYVWPTHDGWNDFKYKTHGMFAVKLEDDLVVSGSILMSVASDEHSDKLEYTGQGNRFSSNTLEYNLNDQSYFSLLSSIGDYRNCNGQL
ncbi:hypothetical protein, partial [Moritella viscosa]|uniref:hypothetical protein n=1 Tax=Moritella viscosa TaxID=80854 RepID=UPI001C49F705